MTTTLCSKCLKVWVGLKEKCSCRAAIVQWIERREPVEACGRGICARPNGHPGKCDY